MDLLHGAAWSFFFLHKPQIRQISLSSSLFIPCWMRMNYDLLLQIFEYLMLPLLLRLTAHSKPFQVLQLLLFISSKFHGSTFFLQYDHYSKQPHFFQKLIFRTYQVLSNSHQFAQERVLNIQYCWYKKIQIIRVERIK